MSVISDKFREALFSVLPITVIVLILSLTLTPLATLVLLRFLIGAAIIIIGLGIFLFGVDIGITPLGNLVGTTLAKTNKLWIVIGAGLVLGFFISIAEPGLLVLAGQVDQVTSGQISSISILITVSIGLAVMVALGFVRIVYNVPLYKVLTVLYCFTFLLVIFTSSEFVAISFDASGATTGILAVPFILALSLGVSGLKKDSKASEEDSFGLVSIASVGAIVSVMVLSILSPSAELYPSFDSSLPMSDSLLAPFFSMAPAVIKKGLLALLPLMAILIVSQKFVFRLNSHAYSRLLKGFVYSFLGLSLFLLGVNAGFMEVGALVGRAIVALDNPYYIVILGFVLGIASILAEPAVYVLTHQIENVTSGYVKRTAVLIALCAGVGVAVALSMVRIIVPQVQLWHYLLPGYVIAIALTYVVPKLFVGIAFDAGGVATGPMIATFILAFTKGVADAVEGANVLIDGFGMIAMVALTPILTLQLLGLVFHLKSRKEGIPDDEVPSWFDRIRASLRNS